MLKIYNTLTKQKQVFTPITPKKASMYICGVTVYDNCHIGHARTYLAFDILYRYLEHLEFDVKYVRNITDIDDKIINRSNEKNIPYQDLVSEFTDKMHSDFKALNMKPPSFEPKATDHISHMINIISNLIEKGLAYKADNKDVYFEVKKYKDYGKLSGQNIKQLQSGARVEENTAKKSPLDFVLWKAAKPNEPSWDSPWGEGRPGWHIECSAMSKEILGIPFDIHGGGSDLKFPHHENECAQTCSLENGFANYWMHSGMVQVDSEKMSKSLGNFFTIKDVLKQYHPEIIRAFLISAHYRSSINYSEDNLNSAKGALIRIYHTLDKLSFNILQESNNLDLNNNISKPWLNKFEEALNDDLNTPVAFSVLFALTKEINKTENAKTKDILAKTLRKLSNIIGIAQNNPSEFLSSLLPQDIDINLIEDLISQRQTARSEKNWAKADEIRDKLISLNIKLEDSQNTTLWVYKNK
jgi:cysteinyl-tRNA synthetase